MRGFVRITGMLSLITVMALHAASLHAESIPRQTIVSVEITASVSSSSSSSSAGDDDGGGGGGSGAVPESGGLRPESIDRKNDEVIAGQGGGAASSSQSIHSAPSVPALTDDGTVASSSSETLHPSGAASGTAEENSTSSSAETEVIIDSSGEQSGFYGMCPLLGPFCFWRTGGWIRNTVSAIADSSSLALSCIHGQGFPWLLIFLFLLWVAFLAFWFGMRATDRMQGRTPEFSHRFLPTRISPWYVFNCIALILVICYAVLLLIEVSGAAETSVSLTVTDSDISMSCTENVALGTLIENGDTGAFDLARSATCTVYALNPSGYTLSWQVVDTGNPETLGKLMSAGSQGIDQYVPAVSGVPEAWQVGDGLSAWGGRLSSESTTTDPSWGTDGTDERWLNVGTDASVLVNKTTTTGNNPDIQIIGFRVDVRSPLTMEPGMYSAPVLLTVTAN